MPRNHKHEFPACFKRVRIWRNFRKAVDQDVVIAPVVVLNMIPKTGFVDTNYEHDLNEIYYGTNI